MARYCPEGFYVYLHRRKSDGSPFYIGKGKLGRAWEVYSSKRSEWWVRVYKKHGVIVDVLRSGMDERSAFEMESVLIYGMRELGFNIVNITDGGSGVSGVTPTNARKVYCSDGSEYKSCADAARELRKKYNLNFIDHSISACASGARIRHFGFSFSYEDTPEEITKTTAQLISESNSYSVYCSNGMKFRSSMAAAEWLRQNGHVKASSPNISACIKGRLNSAYGYNWSRDGVPEHNWYELSDYMRDRHTIDIVCSNGMRFSRVREVVDYLVSIGFTKVKSSSVRDVCNGMRKTTCGLGFKYADDPPTFPMG